MSGDTHLTHIDEKGDVRMVDVSQKPDTERVAIAEGFISMHPETLALIVEGKAAKGDVLACARVAGVMAAKQTSPHGGERRVPYRVRHVQGGRPRDGNLRDSPSQEGWRQDGSVASRRIRVARVRAALTA